MQELCRQATCFFHILGKVAVLLDDSPLLTGVTRVAGGRQEQIDSALCSERVHRCIVVPREA